ncbi:MULTISPECIES: hypothetical protein [Mycolicibacterium]|jgi:hypothetical protein|uniref:Uncharacterized protein n=1 Tax=Mycolicibacterium austroafricanum TaxID=39687 RepID=A0ABT8H7K0_MYCAO|nr:MULTISPECIES: hypothetical protein [Mycolicibacterium]MCV7128611.1 hypothetical protein [Mycolicibacterium vanbaalenii PYR-1]MDN4516732.1 hypothetical protein [Mycolicibacterium austroafricanum]MDW5611901.1 hypothetical protein [Mycolicibacterium sp. D5.8-2]PQP52746.1 hypothetical protein C6A88_05145 [Mycolicibacterium austroafricanum]QRZ07235.1 hypothetical protein JN090_01265 [Mycolicibacterium austroafricanum]
MPTVRLQMTSALSAPDLMAVLTDFSPARPAMWPTIDAELTRRPTTFARRSLAALLPLAAPKALRKSFTGPLQAQ